MGGLGELAAVERRRSLLKVRRQAADLDPVLRFLVVLTISFVLVPSVAHAGVTLEIAPLDGGPRTLVDKARDWSNGYTGIAWAPDGASVFAIGEKPSGEYLVPVLRRHSVAAPRTATVVDPIRTGFEATVSPGGTAITETSDQGFTSGRGGVLVRDVATGAVKARMPQIAEGDDLYESTPSVCWSRDGSRVAISAKQRGGQALRVFDVRSGAQLLWGRGLEPIGAQCFSPDGTQLLVERSFREDREAGILDVATSRFRGLPQWNRDVDDAAWSPDGTRIAVAGDSDVALIDPATGWGPSYPAAGEPIEDFGALRWSPDGQWVAYLVSGDEYDGNDLRILPVAPVGPPRVLVAPKRATVGPFAWSPDSTRIAFGTYTYEPRAAAGRAGNIPIAIVSGRRSR